VIDVNTGAILLKHASDTAVWQNKKVFRQQLGPAGHHLLAIILISPRFFHQ
jgi:hypothetical protein